jgi:hypothetical protein
MKTSWSETQKIEAYLLDKPSAEKLVFEAELILRPALADAMAWQKQAYALVRRYSRNQLKVEIEAVHQQLFTAREHAGFRKKILAIFSRE